MYSWVSQTSMGNVYVAHHHTEYKKIKNSEESKEWADFSPCTTFMGTVDTQWHYSECITETGNKDHICIVIQLNVAIVLCNCNLYCTL